MKYNALNIKERKNIQYWSFSSMTIYERTRKSKSDFQNIVLILPEILIIREFLLNRKAVHPVVYTMNVISKKDTKTQLKTPLYKTRMTRYFSITRKCCNSSK